MDSDNLIKCPLCNGFTQVDDAELRAAFHDPKIREQVRTYMAQLLGSSSAELTGVAHAQPRGDFDKNVHSWNPNVPMWRRSPKE